MSSVAGPTISGAAPRAAAARGGASFMPPCRRATGEASTGHLGSWGDGETTGGSHLKSARARSASHKSRDIVIINIALPLSAFLMDSNHRTLPTPSASAGRHASTQAEKHCDKHTG